MNRYTISTPEGSRDRLFSECEERRKVQRVLSDFYEKRGYSEVITPTLEYYDIFTRSGNSLSQETMFKVIDRGGRILVMRPDVTTPIARISATKLSNEVLPQRFYYIQNVFRSDLFHTGRRSEIAQAGIELVGSSGLKADVEVISMAIDSLIACGYDNFYFGLGHSGIINALIGMLGADQETMTELHNLLELSNFAAVSELLARFTDQPACSAIKRLISLFGSEEIIEEVRQIISGVPEAENALSYLENLYALLDSAGYTEKIKLDFSMVNQLDYYTGVLFRGYVSGVGNCVLSGGRYDNLIGTFGRKMPATGFAIDIDALSSGLPPIHRTKTVELIHYEEEDIKKAYDYIGSRPAGSCELSSCGELSDTIELARNKKITRIIVLGDTVTEIEVEP